MEKGKARTQALSGGFEPKTRRGDTLSLVERSKADPSLVAQSETATWQGDSLSLLEKGKTWTQALLCGTSSRLGEETR